MKRHIKRTRKKRTNSKSEEEGTSPFGELLLDDVTEPSKQLEDYTNQFEQRVKQLNFTPNEKDLVIFYIMNLPLCWKRLVEPVEPSLSDWKQAAQLARHHCAKACAISGAKRRDSLDILRAPESLALLKAGYFAPDSEQKRPGDVSVSISVKHLLKQGFDALSSSSSTSSIVTATNNVNNNNSNNNENNHDNDDNNDDTLSTTSSSSPSSPSSSPRSIASIAQTEPPQLPKSPSIVNSSSPSPPSSPSSPPPINLISTSSSTSPAAPIINQSSQHQRILTSSSSTTSPSSSTSSVSPPPPPPPLQLSPQPELDSSIIPTAMVKSESSSTSTTTVKTKPPTKQSTATTITTVTSSLSPYSSSSTSSSSPLPPVQAKTKSTINTVATATTATMVNENISNKSTTDTATSDTTDKSLEKSLEKTTTTHNSEETLPLEMANHTTKSSSSKEQQQVIIKSPPTNTKEIKNTNNGNINNNKTSNTNTKNNKQSKNNKYSKNSICYRLPKEHSGVNLGFLELQFDQEKKVTALLSKLHWHVSAISLDCANRLGLEMEACKESIKTTVFSFLENPVGIVQLPFRENNQDVIKLYVLPKIYNGKVDLVLGLDFFEMSNSTLNIRKRCIHYLDREDPYFVSHL